MIAPNDNPVGRNEPCPCDSEKKYKNCCMGKDVPPKLEPADMRTLLHVLLTKFQQVTRTVGVAIPAKTFDEYPQDAKFNVQYDPNTEMFRFWVEPPKPSQQVIGPRRIILANGRMGP